MTERDGALVSVVVFLLLVGSIAGLIYLGSLLAREPIGMALQAAAFLLMIWARVTFGRRSFHAAANPTQGGLVTTGPYRYMRHPIYAAILLFLWTGIASHRSALAVALGLIATAMLFLRMILEEQLVRRRYPEYAEYARRTRRVVPFLF